MDLDVAHVQVGVPARGPLHVVEVPVHLVREQDIRRTWWTQEKKEKIYLNLIIVIIMGFFVDFLT